MKNNKNKFLIIISLILLLSVSATILASFSNVNSIDNSAKAENTLSIDNLPENVSTYLGGAVLMYIYTREFIRDDNNDIYVYKNGDEYSIVGYKRSLSSVKKKVEELTTDNVRVFGKLCVSDTSGQGNSSVIGETQSSTSSIFGYDFNLGVGKDILSFYYQRNEALITTESSALSVNYSIPNSTSVKYYVIRPYCVCREARRFTIRLENGSWNTYQSDYYLPGSIYYQLDEVSQTEYNAY